MKRFLVAASAVFLLAHPAIAATTVPVSNAQVKLSFAPVVRKTTPSVVNIYAKRIISTKSSPFANDPFFADMFKSFGPPAPRVQSSLGSGVILSSDGLVVSNYHVVGGADQIRVVLNDRREFDADVLLADKQSDLAVLKLRGVSDLPAIKLRPSKDVEVGDLVLAIGNPFGVGQTVSSGIISGLARSGGAMGNARSYFIQTDAPINPGNSGGALVDMQGELVGINTSILTRSGGSNGIGFAIPADLVASFLQQAQAGNGTFTRPWAGMIGQPVDNSLFEGLGLSRPQGMVVADLHPNSPFAEAGINTGDVITAINGNPVNGPAEMLYHMSVMGTGNAADVAYVSGGTVKHAKVRMITAPDTPARNRRTLTGNSPLDGLTVVRINPAVISETDLAVNAQGVVVMAAHGVAARLGFRRGDILRRVNRLQIATVKDAVNAANLATNRWDVTLERNGQPMTLRFNG